MKTVLVTGASRGIGRAIALEHAKKKYNIVITCSKSKEDLDVVAKEIISHGAYCLGYIGDMGDSNTVHQMFKVIQEKFGSVDILVNNAGISYVGLVTDMSFTDWQKIVNTNLSSVFHCCKEAIPGMVEKKDGRIVNISSVWGEVGASCEVAYSATKGGINAMTKALAKELAPSNIQVNAVAPGVIDTAMNAGFSEEERKDLVEEIPVGRMGTPEEVAKVVVGLTDGSPYVTGQIITVDGGWI